MNGIQEYNSRYLKLIRELEKNNSNITGYVNSLTDSSMSTKYDYSVKVTNFLEWCNKPITEINYDDYVNYLSKIQYKEDGSENSSSFKITVYAAIKKLSEYLYCSGKCDRYYMRDIKRPKSIESIKTKEKREKGYLTEKEIKQYLNHARYGITGRKYLVSDQWSKRDYAILCTLLFTGMRCSALHKLDISDINMDNNTITVMDKGSKTRVYNMSNELHDALSEWIDIRSNITDNKIDALFITKLNGRMTQQSISNIVNKYSFDIDGKHITPHKLRATYGTLLYNKTKDIYFVQECMGHNNPKTTELYIRGNKNNNTKLASDIISNAIKL